MNSFHELHMQWKLRREIQKEEEEHAFPNFFGNFYCLLRVFL